MCPDFGLPRTHGPINALGASTSPFWGFRGHNISNKTIFPGRVVRFFPVANATIIHVSMTNTAGTFSRKIAGVARSTGWPNNSDGDNFPVACSGPVEKIYVTGTVVISDLLTLSGPPYGAARATTPSEIGTGISFAIANQSHSGSASNIKGFLLSGRC